MLVSPPLFMCSCGSASWSPGISRLMDNCIGQLLFSDYGEDPQPAAAPPLVAAVAAERGSSGGDCEQAHGSSESSQQHGQQGQQKQQGDACPDPADLGFLSTSNIPSSSCTSGGHQGACGSAGSPPPSAAAVIARALLAEAVLLMEHEPAGTTAAAGRDGALEREAAAAPGAAPEAGEGTGSGAAEAAPVAEPQTPKQEFCVDGSADQLLPEQPPAAIEGGRSSAG